MAPERLADRIMEPRGKAQIVHWISLDFPSSSIYWWSTGFPKLNPLRGGQGLLFSVHFLIGLDPFETYGRLSKRGVLYVVSLLPTQPPKAHPPTPAGEEKKNARPKEKKRAKRAMPGAFHGGDHKEGLVVLEPPGQKEGVHHGEERRAQPLAPHCGGKKKTSPARPAHAHPQKKKRRGRGKRPLKRCFLERS